VAAGRGGSRSEAERGVLKMKKISLIFLLLISFAFSVPRVTIGGTEYNSIQNALDNASAGDIILLDPGVYSGEGNYDFLWSDVDNLTIKGKYIAGQNTPSSIIDVFGVTSHIKLSAAYDMTFENLILQDVPNPVEPLINSQNIVISSNKLSREVNVDVPPLALIISANLKCNVLLPEDQEVSQPIKRLLGKQLLGGVDLLVSGNQQITFNRPVKITYTFPVNTTINSLANIMFWDKQQLKWKPDQSVSSFNISANTVEFYTNKIELFGIFAPQAAGSGLLMINVISAPNPFNPNKEVAHIGYDLNQAAEVEINIHSLNGNLLYNYKMAGNSGYNEFIWSGQDSWGQKVSNGIYLGYILARSGGEVKKSVVKIAVVK